MNRGIWICTHILTNQYNITQHRWVTCYAHTLSNVTYTRCVMFNLRHRCISHNHVTGISTYPQSPLPLGCASPSHMTSHPEVSVCICMSAALLLCYSRSGSRVLVPEVRLMHPLPVKKIPFSHIRTKTLPYVYTWNDQQYTDWISYYPLWRLPRKEKSTPGKRNRKR